MADLKFPKPEHRERKPRKAIARGARPARLRKRNEKGLKRKLADDLFSLYIRTRDRWRCRRCGRGFMETVLQCAHILPKGSYPAVRYDPNNALCLCHGCHRYFTNRWIEWRDFVDKEHVDVASLLALYQTQIGTKLDYSLEAIRWRYACASLPTFENVKERWDKLVADGIKLGVFH